MFRGGFVGKILRVDLSNRKTWVEPLDEGKVKKYGGQVGYGLKIMWDEVSAGVKATDPENRLIFMTGPLTGTRVQSASNYEVISMNPITGHHFAYANSHGFWGPRLKQAGFDGIVIQGKADRPVYLWVRDGECEIRSAGHIWGKKDTFETEDAIREEVEEPKASVNSIGPAGEKLCAGAMVQNEKGHIAAKGNLGLVMGSKYLKAIAVHGTGKIPVAQPAQMKDVAKEWREESMMREGGGVDVAGTASGMVALDYLGDVPIKNFTTNVFPGDIEKMGGMYLRSTFQMKRNPCFGCGLRHCHTMTVTEGPHAGFVGEEPEYEDLSNLGSNLGITDAGTVLWLTDYVDRLGLDGNWAGAVAGWAMEAYERGILTKEMLGGLEMRWGDEYAAAELLRRVAYREGLGDTLAMGLKTGTEMIGGEEAASFAVHIKGETNHAHDTRAVWGVMLGLLVSPSGPNWQVLGSEFGEDTEIGVEPQDRFDPKPKPKTARLMGIKDIYHETLGVCRFGMASLATMMKGYAAATGFPMSFEEAMRMGERLNNLERAFDVRHGFKPEMDLDLSPRLLEPPKDGGATGMTIAPYLEDMVKEYNKLMDWDWKTGKPSPQKLLELDLGDVAEELWP
jgi:aldehyde:ferredoxin oxidoreductase